MRLGVEVILLMCAAIAGYALLSIYFPYLADAAQFYLLLAVACTVAIVLLEHSFPIEKPPRWIMEAAAYSYTAMMLTAMAFMLLHSALGYAFKYVVTLTLAEQAMAVVYFLLVALGEDLFTYGLPLALEKRTPLGKGVYLVFLGLFAALHYPAYGNLMMLLQPFCAACFNMYIVKKYRNVAGPIIGHWLTDVCLVVLA